MPAYLGFPSKVGTPALPTPPAAAPLSGLNGPVAMRMRVHPLDSDFGRYEPNMARVISLPTGTSPVVEADFFDSETEAPLTGVVGYVSIVDARGVARRKNNGRYAALIPLVPESAVPGRYRARLPVDALPPDASSALMFTVQPFSGQDMKNKQAAFVSSHV